MAEKPVFKVSNEDNVSWYFETINRSFGGILPKDCEDVGT